MAVLGYQKAEIVKKFQRAPMDTGSSEVQVALLTARIKDLTEHFKVHKKDHHGRYGLVALVNQRKKLLAYIRKNKPEVYTKLIADLELRK
ncbi:MAG: 30S ribosomal protein S15 [Bdellovibrionales bacterium]|jgi:small subunit ribosomal protein S15|nr:30S ribosomal protein S15 [Bdellovibrionales bacterium]